MFNATLAHGDAVKASRALEDLALDAEANRKLAGGITMVSGAAIAGINIAVSEDAVVDSLIVGGVFGAIGAAYYLVPSRVEKAAERVSDISDVEAREEQAFQELMVLSEKAKSGRIVGGIAALGLGFLFINHHQSNPYSDGTDVVNGALFAAWGASSLLFKTPEERAFDRVNRKHDHAFLPEVQFALTTTHEQNLGALVQLGWEF